MKKPSKYALAAILAIGISHYAGATLTFNLQKEFSGGATPAGFLRVEFTNDPVDANTVDLKITSFLVGTEFVSDVYLNLNPDPLFNPGALVFNLESSSGTFTLPTITKSADSLQADGGGRYDIQLAFSTSGANRFNLSDTITYEITGITDLDELDFNFLSSLPAGNGTQKAAAHIQAIAANSSGQTSGFVAPSVPDGGATAMLLGIALASLGAFRRRLP